MNRTRLEDLREEKNLKKKEVASDLGVSASIYGRWENDRDPIPTRRLYKLGNYFQVNLDYLLKLSDTRVKLVARKEIDSLLLAKRLREARESLHCSQRDVAIMLDTTSSTWSAYETGKVTVLSTFLIYLCKKAHFSTDYVLGRSEEKKLK